MHAQHARHDDPPTHTSSASVSDPRETFPPTWNAELALRFDRTSAGKTRLAQRHHAGPLRVQRMLRPEGADIAHAVLLHPPGGIAGGDRLSIDVQLDPHANVLVTTPGSAKWYRSDGLDAHQQVTLTVADGACLEWLPQEAVLFDGAHVRQSIDIALAPDAAMFGWDIVQLGRLAADERWQRGHLHQRLALRRGGRLCWIEQGALAAASPLHASPLGLAGHAVFATAWASAPALARTNEAQLAQLRTVAAQHDVCCGITWLAAPAEVLVIRALADSVAPVRALFERLWHTLRPCIAARPPQRPRLWDT